MVIFKCVYENQMVVVLFDRDARKMAVFCVHTDHTHYANIVVYVMNLYLDMTVRDKRIFKGLFSH